MHALVTSDFRTRKIGADRFAIWQLVGNHWERLADVYPTRQAAQDFIRRAVAR
ncbi:hypothetical protein [Mycolicibacterium sp.]|uniref:hypothetical protein n=1 Tax=Mycolicibacterium sp. TaxID=2320850 RepID=UPI001D57EA6A|nr:hypothetical protein [Mycolicibacterium sp.]MCB1291290.1 hypothetical protein [Mycobacterium sp.]MCB9407805.1 hypothetical protein [Mycolicibacterium sp.]